MGSKPTQGQIVTVNWRGFVRGQKTGPTQTDIPRKDIERAAASEDDPPAKHRGTGFDLGEKVYTVYIGSGEVEHGTIDKKHADGTYNVLFGPEVPFWAGKNLTFNVDVGNSKIIRALDEGVCSMKEGEKSLLEVSHHYAYGSKGHSGMNIPPKATCYIELELVRASFVL